jgi:hypothetical protein
MKPASERKAELADKVAKAAQEGTADAIAGAIIDAIDQSMRERNRPGKRDRSQSETEAGTTS